MILTGKGPDIQTSSVHRVLLNRRRREILVTVTMPSSQLSQLTGTDKNLKNKLKLHSDIIFIRGPVR